DVLEKHHKVRVLDEAIEDAVKLSHRYITDRQLPDKSVTLLDTACARVALSQAATPPALEDCKREIQFADTEIGILEREMAGGTKHEDRLHETRERKAAAESRLAALQKRWEEERGRVEEIRALRHKLEAHAAAGSSAEKAKDRLGAADEERIR